VVFFYELLLVLDFITKNDIRSANKISNICSGHVEGRSSAFSLAILVLLFNSSSLRSEPHGELLFSAPEFRFISSSTITSASIGSSIIIVTSGSLPLY
jgi:hypothetical protein